MVQPFLFQRYRSAIAWPEILHDNRRKHKTKDLEEWMKTASAWLPVLRKRHLILGTYIHSHRTLYAWTEGRCPSQLYRLPLHAYSSLFLYFPYPRYNPPPCIRHRNPNTYPAQAYFMESQTKNTWIKYLKPIMSPSKICNNDRDKNKKKMQVETCHLPCPMLKAIKIKCKKKWHHTSIP